MKLSVHCLALLMLAAVALPSWAADQNDAAALFKSKCVMCHGADGSGNTPSGKALKAKDLRAADTQAKTDEQLTQVVTGGRNKMPAFGQKLKPDQIHELVAYIRQLGKK